MQPDSNPSHRYAMFVKLAVAMLVTLAWFSIYECRQYCHYSSRFGQARLRPLDVVDIGLVYWSVLAKSLILMLPLWFLVFLLARFDRNRGAKVAAFLATCLYLCWFVIDLRVTVTFGCHLSSYIGGIAHRQFTGNLNTFLQELGLEVILTWVGVSVAFFGVARTLRKTTESAWIVSKRGALTLVCGMLLLIGGVFPARMLAVDPLCIAQIYERFPLPLWGFRRDDLPSVHASAFESHQAPLRDQIGRFHQRVNNPPPIDGETRVDVSGPKHVIFVLVESFRHNIASNDLMPRLSKAKSQGLFCSRHHAGSNGSALGAYAMVYGRHPVTYHGAIAQRLQPQACVTFKLSGYQTSLISSTGFNLSGMDLFMNDQEFDSVWFFIDGYWPKDDRGSIAKTKELAREKTPQFMVLYLQSTHYAYEYPPEYARHLPDSRDVTDRQSQLNRYKNSVAFMDDQLGDLIDSVDLSQTILVITGDHGESQYDDGTLSHGSQLSDAQTHVPLLIIGGGVPRGEIKRLTSHDDILPTVLHALAGHEVALKHCHGRDLLSEQTGPDQRLLIGNPNEPVWNFCLVRPAEKLLFSVNRARPQTRFLGPCDDTATVRNAPTTAEEARIWCEALGLELTRLSQ